jgi:hypothetical protein
VPARLRDIQRALGAHGIRVEEPRGGSHWKATDGRLSYPIPAHNGLKEEIPDKYVRGLCRAFGIDYASFVREL